MEDKIITFETFYDFMLANIIKTKFEANGIPCFLTDENISGMTPLFLPLTRGMRLQIFEKDLDLALKIRHEEPPTEKGEGEAGN